ncbi:hypothetical protein U91I_02752 [alpha proteobacterium U9-1i]|nr:hypothetical protein U91I_02752 [alpha proteobacterium U9-1i]
MKIGATLVAIAMMVAAMPIGGADAQVRVRGHYRSDGTYVRPHVRSAPNNTTTDNYGPSRSSPYYSRGLADLSQVPPSTRDADRDGVANLYDADDDNDGIGDDRDRTQYGAADGLLTRPAPVRTPWGYKLPD